MQTIATDMRVSRTFRAFNLTRLQKSFNYKSKILNIHLTNLLPALFVAG